jgi:gamma-glutamyltranspeptidase/glutathione hydrolase
MWDVLSWGVENTGDHLQSKNKKVNSINALGVAPTGATADFFKSKGVRLSPEYGPSLLSLQVRPVVYVYASRIWYHELNKCLHLLCRWQMGYPMEDETAEEY